MTWQWSPHSRFPSRDRAAKPVRCRDRNPGGPLPLDEALDYVFLLGEQRPERLPAGVLRWHGRLELGAATLTLEEAQAALAVLALLSAGGDEARPFLRRQLRYASRRSCTG